MIGGFWSFGNSHLQYIIFSLLCTSYLFPFLIFSRYSCFYEHTVHALVKTGKNCSRAPGEQKDMTHLGHVLVREQVQRSTALSLLSLGKQAGTVWAVGSTALVALVTVMVISHPVFSPEALMSHHRATCGDGCLLTAGF